MADKPGGRRLTLPLHGTMIDLVAPPTVDRMRARLGGRVMPTQVSQATSPGASVGDIVRTGHGEPARAGVVLAIDPTAMDVFASGSVRRTRGHDVRPWLGAIPPEIAQIAARARAFDGLVEGAAVQLSRKGSTGDEIVEHGLLLEKCRWGALVERGDGVVLGVGFQRLSAVSKGDSSN